MHPFEVERNGLLSLDAKPPSFQIPCQHDFLDRLEQTGTEAGVQLVGGVNDFPGNVIDVHDGALSGDFQ
jgi:hypothetical protein